MAHCSVARVLLEDKVPSFTTQESFHNSVIELGGWGWLEQRLFTRYRMFHALLSPISELTWRLTSESDLPVAREIILTRVIKCLNLNVVSCCLLCDRWSEWAVCLDFFFYRKKICPFILKYNGLHTQFSLTFFDHCKILRNF